MGSVAKMGQAGQIAKVTSKGQITIPAETRALLGVGPGDRVEFVPDGEGRVVARKAPHPLAAIRGIIRPAFPVTGADIDRWCREVRENGWGREPE
jgi:AbrB family looped-hinge helix DNA binding protein